MSIEARELTLVGGGSSVQEMVRQQTENMKQVIMDSGGKVQYVALGMNFQVFLSTETGDSIDYQPISEKMSFFFQYDSPSVIALGMDSDKRIGEAAFQLSTEILKQISEAFKAGKLDEHRPEG